jgi:hypothetical protein
VNINNKYQVFGSLDAAMANENLPALPSICSVSGLPKQSKFNKESNEKIKSFPFPVPLLP